MLAAYYSKAYDNLKIFSNLKISKDTTFLKYLNKFDVIYLDLIQLLRDCDKNNIIDFVNTQTVKELKDQ